ncbi:MAG: phosphatidylglycerophosphatase A [Ignavibacteriae bacterium]|nr:phosphatidylglycerophosphatase A [Ignavibacteriota bacterium]NOG98253.1 phosphatidylglycerophosphatase A [Ignavibacteriota bacterium]
MKLNLIERIIGSGIFTGYIPFASGTFGSLAAIIIYLIPGFENPTIMLIAISFFLVLGAQIGSKFEKIYGKDPKECTIDEFVGTWISLLFLPKNAIYIAGAFLIWRFFDIIKPFPANVIEKIKGGWGIMLDDVVAGFYSFIVIQIIIYFIY